MNYLFNSWNKINRRLRKKKLYLFLDYDGTLTPIRKTPAKVALAKETKELLVKLSKNSRFKVAIISGRTLRDIKNQLKLKDIVYVGNHGLEIKGPNKIHYRTRFASKDKAILRKIKTDLNKKLSSIRGVMLEDKGLSLAIHYRLAKKRYLPKIIVSFYRIISPYAVKNKIKLKYGKMLLELGLARNWDKGKAVLWLLAKEKAFFKNIMPIYVGDDKTDEDAFGVLKNKGLTVVVGKKAASCAGYYVKNSRDVIAFLKRLCQS